MKRGPRKGTMEVALKAVIAAGKQILLTILYTMNCLYLLLGEKIYFLIELSVMQTQLQGLLSECGRFKSLNSLLPGEEGLPLAGFPGERGKWGGLPAPFSAGGRGAVSAAAAAACWFSSPHTEVRSPSACPSAPGSRHWALGRFLMAVWGSCFPVVSFLGTRTF